MTSIEWDNVWQILAGLWPRMASNMTDEQMASYRRVCDPYSENQCRVAMRAWADTQTKYPRPADLARLLRDKRSESGNRDAGEAASERKRAEQARRRNLEDRWAQIRDVIDGCDDDELAANKRIILAANPALQWAAGLDARTSRAWQVFIFRRLWSGLGRNDMRAQQHSATEVDGPVIAVTDAMLRDADDAIRSVDGSRASLASVLDGIGGAT